MRGTWGIALKVLAVSLCAGSCSTSGDGAPGPTASTVPVVTILSLVTTSTAPTVAVPAERVEELEVALVSGDPVALSGVTGIDDPDLVAALAAEALPAGSQLTIDASTVTVTSGHEATVRARVEGPVSADFVLYLGLDDVTGEWLVVGTSEAMP